ncbi:hypothetical protein [Cetobacterium sp.]|uniref:hypothetical protein n=1 Tax=Cetobacterium sp. TaxID=2071632 RepID=UPI003EE5117B
MNEIQIKGIRIKYRGKLEIKEDKEIKIYKLRISKILSKNGVLNFHKKTGEIKRILKKSKIKYLNNFPQRNKKDFVKYNYIEVDNKSEFDLILKMNLRKQDYTGEYLEFKNGEILNLFKFKSDKCQIVYLS